MVSDGRVVDTVREYALTKHERHRLFCDMFTVAMRPHWDQLCYVGLCSGSGRARLAGTQELVETSPLAALRAKTPFDRYVFCDSEAERLAALEERAADVGREMDRSFDVHYVCGDVNASIDEIVGAIPQYRLGNSVLTFCFIDPFRADISFESIRQLCHGRVDLLVLLPLGHDIRRNWERYLRPGHERIAQWLGDDAWRDRWAEARDRGLLPVQFLGQYFGKQLERIGYMPTEHRDIASIRNSAGAMVYWLAFYSKHPRGLDFWRKSSAVDPQPSFL